MKKTIENFIGVTLYLGMIAFGTVGLFMALVYLYLSLGRFV